MRNGPPARRALAPGESGEIVARNSLWKLTLLLLPCVLVVFIAIFGPESFGLRPKLGWQYVAWPGALFFGFAGLVIARQLFETEAQIVIGPRGVFMRQWSDVTIPWEAMKRIEVDKQYVSGFVFKRHVCLYLHDPDTYPRTTWRTRFFGRGWNLGYGHITMMTTGLDHEIEDFWDAIERYAPAAVELDGSVLGRGGAGTPP